MAAEPPVAEAEADLPDGQDIFYVCKKALESLKAKLKAGEEVSQDLVNELTFPEKLADDEVMVPVDMRGVGEEFDDVESMVEKLGPKGTAEAFVKARDYFEANKDKEPEDERPQPMTAAEWKKVLEEDFDEGEEEEDLLEDEEEFEEGEEDDDDAGDAEEAGAEEPAAKKAKTDKTE
ncbi:unnamed protein product [Prorocentrum cordatum]|uniref:Uncharacterized protein n=1 Tax=Prorocentrum cordatum TaxID=2364126 RepID=A0ABN9VZ67_9DINO|nr:unnamed protein product [Polarella glacialis]